MFSIVGLGYALLRRPAAVAAVLAVTASPAVAGAQSAADKATARQLAKEGIKLHGEKKYSQALEKLQRAQSLYEAPIHLLYIARCQVQLGSLVDGAEAYRKLIRTPIDGSTPPAFVKAVEDGEKELQSLEPRVPRLTVSVEPTGVEGLEVTIDGQPMNVAALGVERFTNPGRRVVSAQAPGYQATSVEVELGEGATESVSLKLEVIPGGAPKAGAAEGGGGETDIAADNEGLHSLFQGGSSGLMVGLRLGGVLPGGDIDSNANVSDYVSAGGGGELYAGVRFAGHFAAKLFVEGGTFRPSSDAEDRGRSEVEGLGGGTYTISPSLGSFGLGFLAGSDPRKFGGFGEVDLLLARSYDLSQDYDLVVGGKCTVKDSFSGPALRVGGGVNLPLETWFNVSPVLNLTLSQFQSRSTELSGSCGALSFPEGDVDIEGDQRALNYQVFLGVGGDFLFGDDLFD